MHLLNFDEKALEISDPDKLKLGELFSFFEFRTLGRRILGNDFMLNLTEVPSGSQMNLFDCTKACIGRIKTRRYHLFPILSKNWISQHQPINITWPTPTKKDKDLIKRMQSERSFCFRY